MLLLDDACITPRSIIACYIVVKGAVAHSDAATVVCRHNVNPSIIACYVVVKEAVIHAVMLLLEDAEITPPPLPAVLLSKELLPTVILLREYADITPPSSPAILPVVKGAVAHSDAGTGVCMHNSSIIACYIVVKEAIVHSVDAT